MVEPGCWWQLKISSYSVSCLIEPLLTVITLQFLIHYTTGPLVRAVGNPYRSDLDVKGLVEVIPQRLVSFLGLSAAFRIPCPWSHNTKGSGYSLPLVGH